MGNTNHKIIQRVRDFADRQNLFNVENIIVGVSGGPDSMALLSILCEISASETSFPNITAVHVNHQIRPGDAMRDQQFVEAFCANLGVKCVSFSYDIPKLASDNSRSLEEMGRIMRYASFEQCAQDVCGADYEARCRIAVAHHKDDIAETMLMNLFRGCGLDGLVSPRARNGLVIRPLLCVTKEEIYSYLQDQGIDYVTDYTNGELDCTRNVWRNKILPDISAVSNKDASEALNDTYNLLKEDSSFLELSANNVYDDEARDIGGFKVLPCAVLNSAHKAIASRLIRRLRQENKGDLVDFSTKHLELTLSLAQEASWETKTIDMPFDTLAFVCAGYIGFCKDDDDLKRIGVGIANFMGVIAVEGDLSIEIDLNQSINTKIPNSNLLITAQKFENIDGLEYNEQSWFIPFFGGETSTITITNGLAQMKFTKAGSSSSKVLSKVMSDMHIPRDARGCVLGIKYGEDYLWIPGIGHTNGFVSDKSYEAWKKTNSNADGYFRIEVTRA